MKIVFFGTPEFAVASADAILKAGYDMAAVVTATDKIAGRGHKLMKPALKIWAEENGIPVLQPEKLKDEVFLATLREINADLFVVIAFRMLPEAVWNMPRLGTFNLHASLLPHYRGAAPINWAIINGEKETGVTTFFLKHEIDTGDVIEQAGITIEDDDDAGSLHDKLMALGAEVTLTTLKRIEIDDIKPTPQDDLGSSDKKAPKIFHETCMINWNRRAHEVRNFIRGLSPYPAARAILDMGDEANEYKVFEVKEIMNEGVYAPGEVRIENGRMTVGCAEGAVEILSLQPQGKRRMPTRDFLNGLRK